MEGDKADFQSREKRTFWLSLFSAAGVIVILGAMLYLSQVSNPNSNQLNNPGVQPGIGGGPGVTPTSTPTPTETPAMSPSESPSPTETPATFFEENSSVTTE